jgi:hypothetical protein
MWWGLPGHTLSAALDNIRRDGPHLEMLPPQIRLPG